MTDAQTWFRTSSWSRTIDPVTVVKFTDGTVWTSQNSRHKRRSSHENWFQSWDEAHAFLLSEAEEMVRLDKTRLMRSEGKLEEIKAMVRP
jgi:hypothetical protein